MKKVFIPLAMLLIICMVSSLCQAQAIRGISLRSSRNMGDARRVLPNYRLLDVDLNKGSGGQYIYLSYTKVGNSMPITDLMVVEGENAPPPPGWGKLNQDLNQGAGGKYLYLCYRTGGGAPITDLFVTLGEYPMAPGPGWHRIPVDLNKGAGGEFIYLWYRK